MNAQLTLPDPDDTEAIRAFAASFNGYEHFGSFAECAEQASKRQRATLTDVRNELFMAYRQANHLGEHKMLKAKYATLLPHFERLLNKSS